MRKSIGVWLILLVGPGLYMTGLPFQSAHPENGNEFPVVARVEAKADGILKRAADENTNQKDSQVDAAGAADALTGYVAEEDGCHIDEERVHKDLLGRSVSGWTFEEKTRCRITIVESEYRENTAILEIFVKAVKHVRKRPGWIGKQGTLHLVYEYSSTRWDLTRIEETSSLSDLGATDVYNVRVTTGRPLLVAVDEGDVERVSALLESGENIYQRCRRGETALMIAARRGHIDVARILLKEGLDVDETSLDGLTALMIGASAGKTEMVKFLLDNGADVNFRGPLGCTALHLVLDGWAGQALQHNKDCMSTVRILLDRGADVNIKDQKGLSPLWIALRDGKERIVELLLDKGADVNMRMAASGPTPLMEAVTLGRPAMVKMLVEKGADVYAEKDGVSALGMAKTRPFRWDKKNELIQILESAGARK